MSGKVSYNTLYSLYQDLLNGAAQINSTVYATQNNLSQEVTDRTSSDTNLQNSIQNEITNRTTADSNLQNNISQQIQNEITARSTAVTNLQQQVNSIQSGASGINFTVPNVVIASDANKNSVLKQVDNSLIADNTISQIKITGLADSLAQNLTDAKFYTNASVTGVQSQVTANLASLNTLSSKQGDDKANITTHTNQISSLSSSLSDNITKTNNNTNSILNIQTTITNDEQTVSNLNSALASLQSKIATDENNFTTLSNNVTTISNKVTTNTSTLTDYGNRITNVESGVSNANTNISTNTSSINTANNNISNLQTNVTNLQNAVAPLSSANATNGQVLVYNGANGKPNWALIDNASITSLAYSKITGQPSSFPSATNTLTPNADLNMGAYAVTSGASITNSNQFVTKSYADNLLMNVAFSNITGKPTYYPSDTSNLTVDSIVAFGSNIPTISQTPQASNQLTSKNYVDLADNAILSSANTYTQNAISNITFNGILSTTGTNSVGSIGNSANALTLNLGNSSRTDATINAYGKISNLQNPTANMDAANKTYVDNKTWADASLTSLTYSKLLSVPTVFPSKTSVITVDQNLSLGTYTISSTAAVSASSQLVPKSYVDSAISAISPSPVGVILMWATSTLPSGWLECNGQAVNQTTYPTLYALMTSVPDLRGLFVRGFDNGKGTDSGRALGSNQTDSIANHVHNVAIYGQIGAAYGSAANPGTSTTFSGAGTNTAGNIHVTSSNISFGTETRPKNYALYYIIKAQ